MKTTMMISRKKSTAHVRMPKIITSWMLRASLIARQIVSPTDWFAWKRSDSGRMWRDKTRAQVVDH